MRSFGDPTDIEDDAAKKSLMDWGKISGDSADGIYFALTSVADPTFRKYDRFGYSSYETTVPETAFESSAATRQDRVQFSVNLSHLSLSEQTVGSITLGSARDLKFSAGVGTGLLSGGRYGGGFGREGRQASLSQSGTGSESPFGVFGGGPIGGMVFWPDFESGSSTAIWHGQRFQEPRRRGVDGSDINTRKHTAF